jgi:glycosyltransferase involved in cell wall biosynthesis
MKIAMLSPVSWRTPPENYGAWELVTSLMTEGLVARGVDVTLFATGDSITNAKLESVVPHGYSEDNTVDPKVAECQHVAHCFERAGEFDLIHNNFDFLPLTYSGLVKTPMLTTIHGFSSEKIVPVYQRYNGRVKYVSISNANRHEGLSYIATVYHGIATEEFTLHEKSGDYLLFYGRLHPDKGASEAIRVALATKRRLLLAGIVQDEKYFAREVQPHLGKNGIEYIGPVGPDRRDELLGNALALLHLINFHEPFGLSVVEAMASGTPVIAWSRGSMPELIDDGVHGYVVSSMDEAIEAVGKVAQLPRAPIRQHVVDRFSRERMVDDYIRVYERMLKRR